MKPYWKSKSHVTIFILMVAAHVLFVTSFIIDMYAYMKDPQPYDPEAPGRVTTIICVLMLLLTFIADFIFFTDLFRYIRLKRRLANNVKSNVEIYTESDEGKELAKKEASKMLNRSEIIADITDKANPNDALYEFKQDIKTVQSTKAMILSIIFAVGLPLLIIFLLVFLFFVLFFIALDPNHVQQDLINATSITVLIILIFLVILVLFFIINKVKAKKKQPKEVGIRIYDTYVEQYIIANTEALNETRYKVAFIKMKRMRTKNFYLIKGKVNNQVAVVIIDKREAPEEGIILIEDKYQKANAKKK